MIYNCAFGNATYFLSKIEFSFSLIFFFRRELIKILFQLGFAIARCEQKKETFRDNSSSKQVVFTFSFNLKKSRPSSTLSSYENNNQKKIEIKGR